MDEMWLMCGCQSSKASGESRPGACLSFSARSKGGDHRRWACEKSPPSGVDRRVSAPEYKASEDRVSQAVRKEKGILLEGKERVTGP